MQPTQFIEESNGKLDARHREDLAYISARIARDGADAETIIRKIRAFQIAIPSWALGTGGTRFGRFPIGGEPRNLEEKIEDIGLLHALNRSSNSISLHIPWDIPRDPGALLQLLKEHELGIDSVNSNTFQDQPG